jgi:transposase
VKKRRDTWRRVQPWIDQDRLVFLDETGFTTKISRLYGRCPIGERLVRPIPHGHWKTLTFIAALRVDRIAAPWVIDGPMNGAAFLTHLRQCLAPTLNPGDIVVMDNLPAHKVAGVRDILENVGAQHCCLPPYSLDLNPIDNAFAKLKTLIRSAGEPINGLQQQIGKALDAFSATGCANDFRHAGYA